MATDSAACDIFQQRVLAALTRAGLPSNFQSTEATGLDVALTTINSMSPVTFAELVRDLYGANLVLKGGVLSGNPMFYTSSVMSTGNTKSKMKDAMALIRQAMIQGGYVVPALDSYQSSTFDTNTPGLVNHFQGGARLGLCRRTLVTTGEPVPGYVKDGFKAVHKLDFDVVAGFFKNKSGGGGQKQPFFLGGIKPLYFRGVGR